MRAVDYVRFSTDEQVTEGISLHAQQARVTAYALLKAWDKLRRQVQETLGGRFGPLTSSSGNQLSRLSASPSLPIIVPSMRRLPRGLRYA